MYVRRISGTKYGYFFVRTLNFGLKSIFPLMWNKFQPCWRFKTFENGAGSSHKQILKAAHCLVGVVFLSIR